jgi:hypothetical protein
MSAETTVGASREGGDDKRAGQCGGITADDMV